MIGFRSHRFGSPFSDIAEMTAWTSIGNTIYAAFRRTTGNATVVAFNAYTGRRVSGWSDVSTDSAGVIHCMENDGTYIYIGGYFSTFGGTTRNGLAAVNTSGAVQLWNPNITTPVTTPPANVFDMRIRSGVAYFVGDFTAVQSTTRNRAAACTASSSTSTLQSWDPDLNNSCYCMEDDGTDFYLGGQFTTVNGGTARRYLCSVNGSGTVTGYNPTNGSCNAPIFKMAGFTNFTTWNLFIGGTFTTIDSKTRTKVACAALTGSSGFITSFDPNLTEAGGTSAVEISSLYIGTNGSGLSAIEEVMIGGIFDDANGTACDQWITIDPDTAATAGVVPDRRLLVNTAPVIPRGSVAYINGRWIGVDGTSSSGPLIAYHLDRPSYGHFGVTELP